MGGRGPAEPGPGASRSDAARREAARCAARPGSLPSRAVRIALSIADVHLEATAASASS